MSKNFLYIMALGSLMMLINPSKPMADNVIRVEDSRVAVKVLRTEGIKAVELKSLPFVIPNASIDGLDSPVNFGDMVVLTANINKAQFSDSLIKVKYQWAIIQDGVRKTNVVVWPDGSKVFFSAGKDGSEYTVVLDIDCLFENKNGEVILDADINSPEFIIAKVKVGKSPKPEPEPEVDPDPKPPAPVDPTFPDSRFNLSKFTYDALKTDPNLSREEKVTLGAALGVAFEGISSQIAARSDLKDLKAILAETSKQLSGVFTTAKIDISKTQILKTKLSDKVFELYKSKDINTPEDVQEAWNEFALGLKSYK